jgi:hypothetical protein
MMWLAVLGTIALAIANPVHAQNLDGYASVIVDAVPNENAVELRTRLFAERRFDVGDRVRFMASGFVEGLVADRAEGRTTTAALLRPQELHVEWLWPKADVRVGLGRVVWGRLDEFLPTDVVNPLDVTRFFLEGRSEARMPVGMVRARMLPSDRFTLEGIYVPFFRRGRFDQLDEPSSPFTLAPAVPVDRNDPERTWGNGQGGLRASFTSGRVDWAVTAYRGFVPLPTYEIQGVRLVERFSRFTMVGGDVETVRGEWGLRGEVAVREDLVEGGVGLDRRAGAYRVSGNVIVSAAEADTDTSLVGSIDRSFARETRQVRAFAVYNPGDDSAFARLILSLTVRDNVTLEASAGVFTGGGATAADGSGATGAIGLLASRDFVYARLKVFF